MGFFDLSDPSLYGPEVSTGTRWPAAAGVVAAILVSLGYLSLVSVVMSGITDPLGLVLAGCGIAVGLTSLVLRYRMGGQSRQVRNAWLAAIVIPLVAAGFSLLTEFVLYSEVWLAVPLTILSTLPVFTFVRPVARAIAGVCVALLGFVAITTTVQLTSAAAGGGLETVIPVFAVMFATALQLLFATAGFVRALLLGRGEAEVSVRSVEQAHQPDA